MILKSLNLTHLVYLEDGPLQGLVLNTCKQLTRFIPAEIVCVKIDHITNLEESKIAFSRFVEEQIPEATCHVYDTRDRVALLTQLTIDFDLLLMGAGVNPTMLEKVRGTQEDIVTSRSACSVMMVQ